MNPTQQSSVIGIIPVTSSWMWSWGTKKLLSKILSLNEVNRGLSRAESGQRKRWLRDATATTEPVACIITQVSCRLTVNPEAISLYLNCTTRIGCFTSCALVTVLNAWLVAFTPVVNECRQSNLHNSWLVLMQAISMYAKE